MSSEFAVYLDEECDDLFAKSKVIATSKEIDEYESSVPKDGRPEDRRERYEVPHHEKPSEDRDQTKPKNILHQVGDEIKDIR